MENATKALLIAAAILIAIILIALGMNVLNQSGDASAQAQATSDSTAMQTFNAQFRGYEGTQSGKNLRNLFVVVNRSNKTNPSNAIILNGTEIFMGTHSAYNYAPTTAYSATDFSNMMFKVSFTYGATGYIEKINLEKI